MMLADIKSEHGGSLQLNNLSYPRGTGQEWGVEVLPFEPKMEIKVKGLPVTTTP